MNYYGVYHQDYAQRNISACDAPCISKGRMMLCACGISSEGSLIAMTAGRLRNRDALAAALDCPAGTEAPRLVLKAYRRWGSGFPSRLEGPVAACVMDVEADRLVLSRDRMGEQMVFYTRTGDGWVAFADHPDTLLKNASAEPAMDADGLRELFGLGPARTPGRTPLRNVEAVEPGCALVVTRGDAHLERYFRIEDAPHGDDEAGTVETVRGLLEQAVDDVAALRPSVMLSGGLDSTALTALLAKRLDVVLSFSVDYTDNAQDFRANAFRPEMDGPYVAEAVRAFGTQHRQATLEQQSLASALGRAVSLRGFPGMADIDTSLLLFSREIARLSRNVVSGECGDEVFGGYPWFRDDAEMEGFPWSGSMELRESLLLPDVRETLKLREYVSDVFETRRAAADPGRGYPQRERRLRTMQRLYFDFFMANLQERAARMCEGAGVRVLTLLCDDRLVQYVYNVPWEMKFMGGQEKGLLRAAVADLLPEKLLRRTKSPYPKTCSPGYGQILRQMALRMTMEPEAPLMAFVDRAAMARLARSELDPVETPWFGQLMAGPQLLGYLWQVNRWMRERNIRVML